MPISLSDIPILMEDLIIIEEFENHNNYDWTHIIMILESNTLKPLNITGYWILKLIDGKNSVRKIISKLKEKFEIINKSDETIKNDVVNFLNELEDLSIIKY